MATHAHAPHAHHAFNPADPHGEGTGHAHHVTPAFTLRFILAILLMFTAMTVAAAQVEIFIAHTFNITLPLWVNVVVALSIATVKSVLVLLYFMHLKHDNPINGIIFIFTMIAFVIFLTFTMLDIGNRGTVDRTKLPAAVAGGSGITVYGKLPEWVDVSSKAARANRPIIYSDKPMFVGAVDLRYAQIEAPILSKIQRPLYEARLQELLASPPDAAVQKSKTDGISIEDACKIAAFNDTLAKARDLAAPETRRLMADEFKYAVSHGGLPHPEPRKRLEELLGPELFMSVAEHAGASSHDAHHSSGTSSTAQSSRAKKGLTEGLFEKSGSEKGAHPAADPAH